jgi:hypothetical protein
MARHVNFIMMLVTSDMYSRVDWVTLSIMDVLASLTFLLGSTQALPLEQTFVQSSQRGTPSYVPHLEAWHGVSSTTVLQENGQW